MSDINPSPEFEEKVRRAVDVPDASPAFVNRLRNELTTRPATMKPRFLFRPAWAIAFVLALALVAVSVPGVSAAIGRIFGYVPGVGLVETSSGLRMLAEPVSVTREGVTLTVKSVFVFEDRVELAYEVTGIEPVNDGSQAEDARTNPTAFCGGVKIGDAPNADGDARLKLPDGTLLERDNTGKYPQDRFAMKPVYAATIPTNVTKMTLVLDCIPWARRGAVPENWSVPFELKSIPAGTVVGAPVINVQATSAPVATETAVVAPVAPEAASSSTVAPALPKPNVTLRLEKIVPLASTTVIYLSMDMENKDPSLVSIMPMSAYVIDSQGQKIPLRGNYVWQPFEHRVGSEFEFTTQSKPAAGPLTVVVEKAVAYYAPLHVDPPQAKPSEMEFTFDAGEHPQLGQTWTLNNSFEIAGYPIKITSARATTYDEVKSTNPDFNFDSQGYEYGYDFVVETDPSVKILVEMAIMSESPVCWLNNVVSQEPANSSIHYTQLCRNEYPKGKVTVQLWQLAVLMEDTWQATWTPPVQ